MSEKSLRIKAVLGPQSLVLFSVVVRRKTRTSVNCRAEVKIWFTVIITIWKKNL